MDTLGPIFEFDISTFSPIKHGGIIMQFSIFADAGNWETFSRSYSKTFPFVSTVAFLFPQSIQSSTFPRENFAPF